MKKHEQPKPVICRTCSHSHSHCSIAHDGRFILGYCRYETHAMILDKERICVLWEKSTTTTDGDKH